MLLDMWCWLMLLLSYVVKYFPVILVAWLIWCVVIFIRIRRRK